MNKYIIVILALLLGACSTSPVQQVNYFVLSGASISESQPMGAGVKIPVLIEDIRLAEYLNQSNLAMQLNSNQIYYSRQHAWAERLELGIEKTLLADLNQSSEFHYSTNALGLATDNLHRLIVQIDHFVATDKSNVIASGSYWIAGAKDEISYNHKNFNLTVELEKDGYAHAVEKMRFLVSELSAQIEQDIRASKA